MALLSILVKAIADAEGLEETQVAWIARQVREAGLLSQAGRGRGAAHMTVTDAANLLIGVNATSNVKGASEAVRLFRELPIFDNGDEFMSKIEMRDDLSMIELESAFAAGSRFGSTLETLIKAYSLPHMHPGALEAGHGVRVTFKRPLLSASVFIGDSENEDGKSLYAVEFANEADVRNNVQSNRTEQVTITGKVLLEVSNAIFQ